jgi:hypothetical protein
MTPRTLRHKGEAGQAAVEAALVLPLTLFLILGTLQLALLQQARISAQYAAFQAARVGSVHHGACKPMTDAALLSVLSTFHSFLGDPTLPGTPAQKLAGAFARVKDNHYAGFRWGTWRSAGTVDEAIVWIVREGRLPTAADVTAFDQPLSGGSPLRLELRVVYWAPLRIPFADWVYARIAAARMVGMASPGFDPFSPTRKTTDWSGAGLTLDGKVAAEFSKRISAAHYVFPITVSATMRMMTPPRLSEFGQGECPAAGLL